MSEYGDKRYCMTADAFIPALYIAGDKEDASHLVSPERVSIAIFGETFADISVSGQCDTLNLCCMYTYMKGKNKDPLCTLCRCFSFQGNRSTRKREQGNKWREATVVTNRRCIEAVSTNAKE